MVKRSEDDASLTRHGLAGFVWYDFPKLEHTFPLCFYIITSQKGCSCFEGGNEAAAVLLCRSFFDALRDGCECAVGSSLSLLSSVFPLARFPLCLTADLQQLQFPYQMHRQQASIDFSPASICRPILIVAYAWFSRFPCKIWLPLAWLLWKE